MIPVLIILILFVLAVLWIKDKPDQLFWLSLLVFFDPGGYFYGLIGMDILWRIKYYDFLVIFMWMAYLASESDKLYHNNNPVYKKIIHYLVIITLFFLFFTGIFVPMHKGYFNFPMFLQKNRQFFYAMPILFFVFHFSFRNVSVFYKYLVYSSAILLTLFFVTLLTGINLMPISRFSRYVENDRISMISYGLTYLILPLGLIVFSYGKKLKIPHRGVLIYSMILLFLATLLTLTRRELLGLCFMLVAIPYLISWLTSTLYLRKMLKYIFPVFLVGILVLILFPSYLDLLDNLIKDTTSILMTGQDTHGIEEYRVKGTGDMLLVKDMIRENPIWGIGFYPAGWNEVVNMQSADKVMGFVLDASGEVPIYGAILRLGIIGLIVPLFFYFLLGKLWFEIMKYLKSNINNLIDYPTEIMLTTYLLFYFLSRVVISPYSLFSEFYDPYAFVEFLLMLGLLLGLYSRIKILNRNIIRRAQK